MHKGNARPTPYQFVSLILSRYESLLKHFHSNARETVAGLVAAILLSGSLGQTCLAAHLPCSSRLAARIKRVQRYFNHTQVNTGAFWSSWTRWVCRRYLGHNQRARVAIDWTKEGKGSVLSAMLVIGGRGIPLMCRCFGYDQKTTGMAREEIELATAVRKAVPSDVRIIWLMDRGFSNARMVTLVQSLPNSNYVIRARGNLLAQTLSQKELLKNWNPRARKTHLHRDVRIGTARQFSTNILLTPSFSKAHASQWILMTDLESTRDIRELYAARWAIEAQFKDLKSQIGFDTPRYEDINRIERLMMIAAMAMELAFDEGSRAETVVRPPRDWEKDQRMVKRRAHVQLLSVFMLGLAAVRVQFAGPPGMQPSHHVSGGVS